MNKCPWRKLLLLDSAFNYYEFILTSQLFTSDILFAV